MPISEIPVDTNIPFWQLFEQIALHESSLNSVAIELYEEQYTYRQIYDAVDALAVKLHQEFFGKEKLIGLAISRSPKMIIAMLAIWKARLAFTPMDPKSSKGVLEFWVDDSEIQTVICDGEYPVLAEVIQERKLKSIAFDQLPQEKPTADKLEKLSAVAVSLEDTAYVMYTSGSTGDPKGVEVKHAGLNDCLKAHDTILDGIKLEDAVAQFSSITFDAIMIEIMMALGRGAKLVLVPQEVRDDIVRLAEYYCKHHITIAILTPKQLKLLNPKEFLELRGLFIVGEAFDQNLSDAWMTLLRKVINGYGLTETTICTTLWLCEKGATLTIGKPIEGLQVELRRLSAEEQLDKTAESDEPIQMSAKDIIDSEGEHYVEGELIVFGRGLARGYWGKRAVALNKERFFVLDHPRYGKVLAYRTGDICVYAPGGNLVVQGRLGREIKLRAQRIHPAVIENRILECQYQGKALVLMACVVAQQDERHEKRLVAHVVFNPEIELSESNAIVFLHRFLKTNLPVFALPAISHIVPAQMEAFKTVVKPGDKRSFDVKKISAWPWPRQHLTPIKRPGDKVETQLQKIWFDLLAIPDEPLIDLSIEEDFFDLGGDSLKFEALKLALEKQFSSIDWNRWTPAPIGQFTIHSIAAYIHEQIRQDVLVTLAEGNKALVCVVHSLIGDPAQDYPQFKRLFQDAHHALLGLKPPLLDYLPETLEELAKIYLERILRIYPDDMVIRLVGWSTGGVIALEMARQLRAQKRPVQVFVLDSFCPMQFKLFQPIRLLEDLQHMKRKFAEALSIMLHRSADDVMAKWSAVRHEVKESLLETANAWFDGLIATLRMIDDDQIELASQRFMVIKRIFLMELVYGLSDVQREFPLFTLFSAQATRQVYGEQLGWGGSCVQRHLPLAGDHFALVAQSDLVADIFHEIQQRLQSAPFLTWNLPYRNLNFVSRKGLSAAINAALEQDGPIILAAMHGLGGVGKTQSALDLCYNAEQYTFRAWFAAEDIGKLRLAYVRFGQEIGILKEQEGVSAQAIRQVIQWLEAHPGWLIVYDNATSTYDLQPFLPQRGGKILITTRNASMMGQRIFVDVLTEEEAIALFKKITDCSDCDEMRVLVKLLGRLPLAIAQAGAFIARHQISVAEYLSRYKACREAMLRDTTMPEHAEHEPVAVTWQLSMNVIKRRSKNAELLMNLCAYLYADEIPVSILMYWLNDDVSPAAQDALDAELSLLLEYSMLCRNQDRRTISIHRLVQDVIRDRHKHFPDENPLVNLAKLLARNDISHYWDTSGPTMLRWYALTPHVVALNQYADEMQFFHDKRLELCLRIGSFHNAHGDLAVAETALNQALEVAKQIGHTHVNGIYKNLLNCYMRSKRWDKVLIIPQQYLDEMDRAVIRQKIDKLLSKHREELPAEQLQAVQRLDQVLSVLGVSNAEQAYLAVLCRYALIADQVTNKGGLKYNVALLYKNLGCEYLRLDQFDCAAGCFRQAYALYKEMYQSNRDNTDIARTAYLRSKALARLPGGLDKAIRCLEKSLAAYLCLPAEKFAQQCVHVLMMLSEFAQQIGDVDAAVEYLHQAKLICQQPPGYARDLEGEVLQKCTVLEEQKFAVARATLAM